MAYYCNFLNVGCELILGEAYVNQKGRMVFDQSTGEQLWVRDAGEESS